MRILLVDDDPKSLDLLEAMLLPGGYELVKCKDGESALKIMQVEKIDLVVSDVMMPGMTGFEVARKIKKEQEIPVILLTSLVDRDDLLKGFESGADEFLSKPVLKEELLLRIKNILRIKEYQNTLEAKVLERTNELREALISVRLLNLEMSHRLLLAVEYRDDSTGRHIIRVGKYSGIVAKNLGLKDRFIELIESAAPMHDIGKIAIPDAILLRKGKLSPEEFEIMKTHTTIGARILKGSSFPLLTMGSEIALSHHEKWNGMGYPLGKKGEATELTGRIVAIADVFDALTTRRPYKPAYAWEDSLDIIAQEKEKSFDPAVVDAFFKGIDTILSVFKEYRDLE